MNAKISQPFGIGTLMTRSPCFKTKTVQMIFCTILNSCHSNIKFTIEFQKEKKKHFHDIHLAEKTFKGLYTKWDSFTPRK